MKNYRVSNKPKLAEVGQFIYTGKSKAIRKPVKNWKTILKEQKKLRAVKTQARAVPIPAEMLEWLQGIAK
tara:strand:+ start:592 stop:801 length:210 start_codon:yes stop_codon:yes gene_type:complete